MGAVTHTCREYLNGWDDDKKIAVFRLEIERFPESTITFTAVDSTIWSYNMEL